MVILDKLFTSLRQNEKKNEFFIKLYVFRTETSLLS